VHYAYTPVVVNMPKIADALHCRCPPGACPSYIYRTSALEIKFTTRTHMVLVAHFYMAHTYGTSGAPLHGVSGAPILLARYLVRHYYLNTGAPLLTVSSGVIAVPHPGASLIATGRKGSIVAVHNSH
jgi:hypothetical protein